MAEESEEGGGQVEERHGDDDQLDHLVGWWLIPTTDRVHDSPVQLVPARIFEREGTEF